MITLKLYKNGVICGVPPTTLSEKSHKKTHGDNIKGWSNSSTRSNTRFLYSVDSKNLHGYSYALTLTIKDMPLSADDWKKVRERFFARLRRMGMIRLHWVTEWQARGVPHLHSAVFFELPINTKELLNHWIYSTTEYRSKLQSQTCKQIFDQLGWLQYLAKHASRGLNHYQRQSLPTTWSNSGRMWGKLGKWPTYDANAYIDITTFYKIRRIVKNWRLSKSRSHPLDTLTDSDGNVLDLDCSSLIYLASKTRRRRIISARNLLKTKTKSQSQVRGFSEWLDSTTMFRILSLFNTL